MNRLIPNVLESTVAGRRAPSFSVLPALLAGFALTAVGCGGSESASTTTGGEDQSSAAGAQGGGGQGGSMTGGGGAGAGTTTTTTSNGSGGGGSGAGGGASLAPTCVKACQTNADCDQGSTAFSADNYACEGGSCKYLGCNSDAECKGTFGEQYNACSADSGTAAVPTCVKACQTSADCDQGTTAFSADNYVCASGKCKYTGCKSDAECKGTFGDQYGACSPDSGTAALPTCVKACQTSADCDQGSTAFSADNYACEGGKCKYLGCKSDAECKGTFGDQYGVCP